MKEQERITIKLKSYDHKLIDKSAMQIVEVAKRTGAVVRGPVPLKVKIMKISILSSPHVNASAMDQMERRTYKRLIIIVGPTDKTVDELMKLDLSAGVNVEIDVNKR